MLEEVPGAENTSIGVLAAARLDHSERNVQKIAQDFQLTVPLELTQVQISKDMQIPVLLLSSWFKYLMSMNLWYTLSGLSEPDDARCKAQWGRFWNNFKKIMPNHRVFQLANSGVLHLERTAALLLHGDEGRSKKKMRSGF